MLINKAKSVSLVVEKSLIARFARDKPTIRKQIVGSTLTRTIPVLLRLQRTSEILKRSRKTETKGWISFVGLVQCWPNGPKRRGVSAKTSRLKDRTVLGRSQPKGAGRVSAWCHLRSTEWQWRCTLLNLLLITLKSDIKLINQYYLSFLRSWLSG